LRIAESVIDEESERAVTRWVKLGDQLAGRQTSSDSDACASCGSTHRVLERGEQALCAHCYLERGAQSRSARP
jgi:protein-arginine kinase activator protein McsA